MEDPSSTGAPPPRRRGLIGGAVERIAPAVIRQIDLDALVDRLDVNMIADRLDLDALMKRLDMDAIVDRLDVNAVADRLEIDELVARINMAQLTAGATQDVAITGLDLVRRQLVRADATVDLVVDRLLRRQPGDRPLSPTKLEGEVPSPSVLPGPATLRRRDVSGHYAGPVTRIAAVIGDTLAGLAGYGVLGAVSLHLLGVFTGIDITISSGGWPTRVLVASWMLVWFWAPIALFGRTPVMGLLGLAVVRRDGGVADGRRALVRALVMPLSIAVFLLGMIGIVLGKERRTLHDAVAGTAVVYDWGARQAEQPVSIREQLSARVQRRRASDSQSVDDLIPR